MNMCHNYQTLHWDFPVCGVVCTFFTLSIQDWIPNKSKNTSKYIVKHFDYVFCVLCVVCSHQLTGDWCALTTVGSCFCSCCLKTPALWIVLCRTQKQMWVSSNKKQAFIWATSEQKALQSEDHKLTQNTRRQLHSGAACGGPPAKTGSTTLPGGQAGGQHKTKPKKTQTVRTLTTCLSPLSSCCQASETQSYLARGLRPWLIHQTF